MMTCPVLGDPVISPVQGFEPRQLFPESLRILHIQFLGTIGVVFPEKPGIAPELGPGDCQQQDSCRKSRRTPLLIRQQHQCEQGQDYRGRGSDKDRLVHAHQTHSACGKIRKVDPVELEHSRGVKNRTHRHRELCPLVLLRPAQVGAGSKQHGKANKKAVTIPVAFRRFHERKREHSRFPVEHHQTDSRKSDKSRFLPQFNGS